MQTVKLDNAFIQQLGSVIDQKVNERALVLEDKIYEMIRKVEHLERIQEEIRKAGLDQKLDDAIMRIKIL